MYLSVKNVWQFRFVSLHSTDCRVESIQKALAADYNFNVRRAFFHQVLWGILWRKASSAYET